MSAWICAQPSVSLVRNCFCDGGPYGGKIRAVVAEGLGDVLMACSAAGAPVLMLLTRPCVTFSPILSERLRGRVDAQHVLTGTHHAVDFALDCGHQRVPHPGDAVQQAVVTMFSPMWPHSSILPSHTPVSLAMQAAAASPRFSMLRRMPSTSVVRRAAPQFRRSGRWEISAAENFAINSAAAVISWGRSCR